MKCHENALSNKSSLLRWLVYRIVCKSIGKTQLPGKITECKWQTWVQILAVPGSDEPLNFEHVA